MVETAAHATISAVVQTAQPPLANQTGPPPADRRPSATTTPAPSSEPATTTPAPSSEPATTPAAAPVTSVPQPAEATPRPAMAQPAAVSDPSATAPPATASEPPAAVSAAACHEQSGGVKKRKLEPGELRDSTYFKIRAVVRDLRPAFLEVLQAPDFRNCKAADDIRRQLKVLLGLSKLLSAEAVPSEKKTNSQQQPVAEDVKEAVEIHVKRERQVGADIAAAAAAAVPKQAGNAPAAAEKVKLEATKLEQKLHQGHQGTYIVGGSPMGWNFLIYPGGGPVYYGITREAARLRRSAA